MIKGLIFDFGNVFLNLDIAKSQKEVFELFNIDSFSDEMIEINQSYEKGFITTEEFLRFYQDCFPQLSRQQIINSWNSVLKDFPEHRLKFLQQLAYDRIFKLILLSNTNDLHINWVKDNIPFYESFKGCFDAFYLSHEIGLRKPDRDIFEFVLNKTNLNAYECLFIDDTKGHILSASQLGINTWNINPEIEDVTNLFTVKSKIF